MITSIDNSDYFLYKVWMIQKNREQAVNCRYLRKVINCYMLLIIDYIFSSSSISSFKSFSNSSSTSSSIDSDISPKKCAHP